MFPRSIIGLLLLAGLASAPAQDVVEKSDVLVPTGPFGTMRRVDSQTLILPNAGAVMRAQQRRNAAMDSRERAAAQTEALRQAAAARQEASAAAAAATPAAEPETLMVEESLESFGSEVVVEEPALAEPEMVSEVVAEETVTETGTAVEEAGESAPESSEEPAAPQE